MAVSSPADPACNVPGSILTAPTAAVAASSSRRVGDSDVPDMTSSYGLLATMMSASQVMLTAGAAGRRPLIQFELSQRLEPCAHLIHQELRLFPRREVPALVELVVMDEVRIGLLRPSPRRMVDLVRKDAQRNRDGDVLWAQVGLGEPLPIETRRRDCRVRQPEQRGVVEHIVPAKARQLPVEGTCDEPQTNRVVVEQTG